MGSFKSRVGTIIDTDRVAKMVARPGIDTRQWIGTAYVTTFEIDEEGPFVDIELLIDGRLVPETARVGAIYAGPGFGVFMPLEKDDEVIVIAPDGLIDSGLVVVSRLWSKSDPPPDLARKNPFDLLFHAKEDAVVRLKATGKGTVIIEAPKVFVRDEAGKTRPLAFLEELQAQINAFLNHIHQASDSTPTSGPIVKNTILPVVPPTIPPTFLPGDGSTVDEPKGTKVLEAQ